jgi:phosphopantetheine adenylyltransferase
MNIKEIDKPEIKKVVVVYAGRFQPFHKGHYATYQKLVSKFGANNVYIGTSNDTSGPKSPFNFDEKKTIMTKMFGISPNKIVQVRNPYAPKEILSGMDGKTTAYVAAVGEKDATRLAGKYFKPYKGKTGYGYDEIGYVYAVPAEDNAISGTDVRNWLSKGDDKDKQKGFTKAYPKFDKDIFNMITGKLNEELYRGYPSEKQVKDIERKNKEFRNSPESTSDDEYLYDPISELIGRAAAEDMFEEFVKSYFKEESEAEKMGLKHLGGGYYGKDDKGPATHKSDNGKIRTLTPQEVDAVKKKSMSKGPSDAPANEPKPSQPGQPVNKGATAQGKIDKKKEEPTADKKGGEAGGKQAPPPEQKLSGAELKSSAEMTDTDKKKAEVKEKLHQAMADLSDDEKKAAEDTNNPESETRKGWYEKLNDWTGDKLHKVGKAVGHVIAHKVDQYKEFGKGMYSIATSGKLGTIKDEETGKKVHWTDFTDSSDDNGVIDKLKYGSSKMQDVPVYKKDSHGHDVHDENGNPVQDTDWRGRPKTQKEPVFREDLSPREKALAKKSWYERSEQLKGIKGTAMDAAVMCASMAVAGAGVGALASKGIGTTANVGLYGKLSVGQAATQGAASAFTHGAWGFSTHLGKDMVKHVAFESVGAGAMQAGGGGAIMSVVTGGILEAIDDKSNEPNPHDMMMNLIKKIGERMGTFKMSDEQMLASIESYKKNKPESDLKNAAMDLMKENISESKQQSIQNFVEYATKRLKLKEQPKINLVGGREFAEVKTSLGGFDPLTKEIFVATEGRLTADILRTLAHEMVHRKQDEMGFVRNPETDGADGSPIENQAHAVAGILMREYGRINKQIYNEDVNVDVDKGDEVLMGKFKNKKVTVKDIGTDSHGMPTINGKQATTFRIPRGENVNEVGPNDWHFKAIMKMWDKSSPFGRKKIGAVVCNDPKADRNDVARKLRNYGYKEVTHVTDKLGLDEKKNLNELTQGLFAGKVKIGGQPVEIEVELLGADNKTKEFITKVIHIDKKYQSKLPIGSEFKIPARIFRMPGGGWHKIKSSAFKESLNEGGAYGHMSHPFDDMDLTFGDLKNIIKGALTGNLELTREKTDGQALAISWKNGRLIAARNKSHLSNGGAGAMGIEDVASKFAGRGGLTDAYNFAMRDLSAAIQALSEPQRKKIFNEGQCFMNLEVIWPTSVNVIPYGQALLVFHNTTCYDEKGTAVGANQGAATMLAGMIKQVNADVQSKYTIQGPPVTELPKKEELSSKQTKYLTRLQKLQFEFQLSDKDGVSEYHQAWWEDFVNKSKVKLQKLEKDALVRRWAFGDKSFRLNTIADKDAQKWAIDNDKVNVTKQQKENVRQFEEIFLGVGADVLSFMGSVLTVNPDEAVRNMKDRLKDTAEKVRGSGDVSKIAKLKMELARLQSIGGKNKIVPNEGIVFLYKGNTYKLTGTFAPLNQILGIFYE